MRSLDRGEKSFDWDSSHLGEGVNSLLKANQLSPEPISEVLECRDTLFSLTLAGR